MATFDYATPKWVDEQASVAINIQTLGRLASTITNITMSVQTAAAAVLPKRSPTGVDYTYADLLFLQQYVFTHMSLMDYEARTDLSSNGLGGEHVLIHTGWLRQISDVMETMAHQVAAGRFPYPLIHIENGQAPGAQDWIRDLQYQASMSVQMADDMDAA